MYNYYNDADHYVCEWLENLMFDSLIPSGVIDCRPIQQVDPNALSQYTQCHFFAGISGWPLALELAGWPVNRPVWTGSCPCQPFSVAGKGDGEGDSRHLWPDWLSLITERNPPEIFGEQVASPDGRVWLTGVRLDLEELGYAVGAADLCAAGIGADCEVGIVRGSEVEWGDAVCGPPHIRQRLYWAADSDHSKRRQEHEYRKDECDGQDFGRQEAHRFATVERSGAVGRVGKSEHSKWGTKCQAYEEAPRGNGPRRDVHLSMWSNFEILPCLDGKARRTQSGLFPLAHGVPARVGKLRAYGNAIVPQVAAEFVRAYMLCRSW